MAETKRLDRWLLLALYRAIYDQAGTIRTALVSVRMVDWLVIRAQGMSLIYTIVRLPSWLRAMV